MPERDRRASFGALCGGGEAWSLTGAHQEMATTQEVNREG